MPVANEKPTKRTVVPLATAKAAPKAPAKPAAAPAPKLATAKATPKAAPKAAEAEPTVRASSRGIAGELATKKVKVLVANPKRPNSNAYAMFELYKNGMTYADLRAAGVSVADIQWNLKHEFIAFN